MISTEVTPNTSVYMIAGYAIFFGVIIIYLISLLLRWNILKRDISILEGMEKQESIAEN